MGAASTAGEVCGDPGPPRAARAGSGAGEKEAGTAVRGPAMRSPRAADLGRLPAQQAAAGGPREGGEGAGHAGTREQILDGEGTQPLNSHGRLGDALSRGSLRNNVF